jgi:His-Xaa-Ser system protein HxsD
VVSETVVIIDTTLYGLDTVHRTCYSFTNRYHVRLERIDESQVRIVFRSLGTEPVPGDLVASFENELIDHRIRADLARETSAIRDLIFRQAFVEADL